MRILYVNKNKSFFILRTALVLEDKEIIVKPNFYVYYSKNLFSSLTTKWKPTILVKV